MTASEDLAVILRQERELQFPQVNQDIIWRLGTKLRDLAILRSLPLVIDIRRFGQPLFYYAMEGSSPDNAEWARRKSNVVARFHHSSYFVGLELKMKKSSLQEKYALPDAHYAAHGGAFPLSVVGCGVIGSVAVSGLPQRADHELVVEALCAETEHDYAGYQLPQA